MKSLFIFLCFFVMFDAANAYVICGPAVSGLEYSYGKILSSMEIKETSWMVGRGCVGVVENIDTDTMCETPVVVGQARCFINQDGTLDLAYEKRVGSDCMCRRTGVYQDGIMTESIGEWVQWGRLSSNSECMTKCPQLCAETIVNNVNKQRNAIMLFPQFTPME